MNNNLPELIGRVMSFLRSWPLSKDKTCIKISSKAGDKAGFEG